MNGVLQNIRDCYGSMSKGQKSIADFILGYYEEAAYMTAARLGRASQVSESTVVRFAMELGYSGFPEFQKMLREDLKEDLTAAQRMKVSPHLREPAESLYSSALLMDAERLRKVAETKDVQPFNQAVDMMLAAKTIYILGVRSSASLASFMYFYLNQIFSSVHLIESSNSSEILEQMISIEEGDVLVVMSFPRYSSRIVNALAYAQAAGGQTIVLTDKKDTPFTQHADCVLVAPSDMIAFVDSLVVPFSTITALIAAVAMRRKDNLTKHLEKLEMIWDEYAVYEKRFEEDSMRKTPLMENDMKEEEVTNVDNAEQHISF
ncbi:MAG: MurR/RpiR family transcriptional regulator [Fastidiosipilaceae bacterium]|jgi:DNA-binding MurR/RpiR family transcriptional regulator